MKVEEIKSLAQQTKGGLLDSLETKSAVKCIVDGLGKACLEVKMEKDGMGHIRTTQTETNKQVVIFFNQINQDDLVDYVGDRKGVELAKCAIEKMLELAHRTQNESEIVECLELFRKELG